MSEEQRVLSDPLPTEQIWKVLHDLYFVTGVKAPEEWLKYVRELEL